jgi:tetratricopeptide (TPR) repeat protein
LAQSEAEQALSVDPASIRPCEVGDICHCRGDLTRAEREYQRILEQKDPASRSYGWSRLAALYLSEGKFEKAKAQLLQASALADQVGDAERKMWLHLDLAQLNLARGKPSQAMDEWKIAWKIALAQDLDLLPHLHLKGLIALQTKSIEQAENVAGQLKKTLQAKKNKKLMRYYHHLAGMIELAKGDFSEAISCLERAISLLPSQHSELDDHAMFLYPLASAYYASGDLQRAQEHYKRITSLTTGRLFFGDLYAKSFYMLGKIYDEKGWKEEAVAHYGRFIQLWAEADSAAPELARARGRLSQKRLQT